MAGIYIHIPFCKQACTYCNFHFSTSMLQKDGLLNAINNEILLTPLFSEAENIHTIYIGGGTPSLLASRELENILASIHKKFNVADDAEITLEANPDDINKAVLFEWKKIGINRLSLGVQSFVETELRWMNRAHQASQSLQSIDDIMEAGYSNFSVDLIYGSPLLSDDDLINNLQIIFSKNIPHISCYALTVEPKTALDKMIGQKNSLPVDPEKQSAQFLMIMQMMKDHGYEHYEISNFAKPSFRSIHNSNYWHGKPYYGFGPSAHSFDGRNKRQWNIANNSMYILSLQKGIVPLEQEILSDTQRLNEYIMISLRTIEGINLEIIKSKFGISYAKSIESQSGKYQKSGKLNLSEGKLKLTDEGKLFADGIASDLFV
ncbi:MAG: radical SAM family heme chaperone HemW [Ferruginibacter sp.]